MNIFNYYAKEQNRISNLIEVMEDFGLSAAMAAEMYDEGEGLFDDSTDQGMAWRDAVYTRSARLGMSIEKLLETELAVA